MEDAEKGCAMKRYPSPDACRPGPPMGCCPPRCCGGQGSWPTPVAYVPGAVYYAGQVVYYDSAFYLVDRNDPQGTPGSSVDYTRIPMDAPYDTGGRSGPTGPTGPAGPAGGPAGPTGPTEAGTLRPAAGGLVHFWCREGHTISNTLVCCQDMSAVRLSVPPIGESSRWGAGGPLSMSAGG